MSMNELESKITEMPELDKLAQEAKEAADAIRDEIKLMMGDRQEGTVNRLMVSIYKRRRTASTVLLRTLTKLLLRQTVSFQFAPKRRAPNPKGL